MNDELLKEIAQIELEAKKRIEEVCKNATEAVKPSRVWKPGKGDVGWYWSMVSYKAIYFTLDFDRDPWAEKYYEIGELFPTKEACEEAHKAKVIQAKWKRLATESGEEDNPWDGCCKHWLVCYDSGKHKIGYYINESFIAECIYFTSREAIVAAVTEIGEENVKKYILGIKEE